MLETINKDEDISIEEAFNLESEAVRLSLTLRNVIEIYGELSKIDEENYVDSLPNLSNLRTKKAKEFVEKTKENSKELSEKFDVKVEISDKKIKIFTPFLFRRMFGSDYTYPNFFIANLVKKSIEKWLKDNQKDANYLQNLFEFSNDFPLVCEVKRVSESYNLSSVCDNDNIETSRVINVIFGEFLMKSDGAKTMDFVCKYEESDVLKEGTYFTVMPRKDYKIND